MKNKQAIIIVVISALIFVVVLGKYIIKTSHSDNSKNPYELNIDSIGKIDEKNIGYKEIKKIKINFNCPHGIAVGPDDKIYVSGDSLLLKLDNNGKEIARFNSTEIGLCIAVSKENILYAGAENHVEVYTADGVLLNKWNAVEDNCVISSIALKPSGILVADAENCFVYQCDLNGKLLNRFGSKDSTDELRQLVIPSYYFDVAVDPQGNSWVVNPGKHILINFDGEGKIKSHWGAHSSNLEGFCGCCNPNHIAILKDGSFITAEKGIVRVKKYSADGKFICAVAGPDKFTENSKGLDIAIDSKNNIYILEPQTKTIHVFQEK